MAKVLIFTSHGGGGHISASNAIIEHLKDEHEVSAVALFRTVLEPMDPVRFATLNKIDCEGLYNFFLRKKWTRLLNMLCLMGLWTLPLSRRKVIQLTTAYLNKEKPDLVISVIPILNGVLNTICRSLDIPFLIVPTDLDTSTFIHNIDARESDKLYVGLAFNDPTIWKIADKATIFKKQCGVIGFPLRQSFFEQKNIPELKNELNIPAKKPVIFMLMGAVGSEVIYRYVIELCTLEQPFHLIICLGRNEQLRTKLNAIVLPAHITVSIIGFTEKIADLMAVSDFCITKAGSVSVCEALYMNKPLLLDCTAKSLMWEDLNIHFVSNHKFGTAIRRFKDLKKQVSAYLLNPPQIAATAQRIANFKKDNFSHTIKTVVNRMLSN
jgi:UDP-N-acetylglucosamine:LPS N-acetylglucosamine transferase